MPHMRMPQRMLNMQVPEMRMPQIPRMHFPRMPAMQMPSRQFYMDIKPRSPFGFPQSSFSNFSLF